MDADDLVLLILGASRTPVRGRTVIQKTGYFANVAVPEAKGIQFKPHYYGPYSPEIASALIDAVAMGYVREEVDSTPSGNVVYTYELTTDGRGLAETLEGKYRSAFEGIKAISKTCDKDAHANPNVLSWAAKTHFLLRQSSRPLSAEEAAAMGSDFNWELSTEDLGRGLELLLRLGLVTPATA